MWSRVLLAIWLVACGDNLGLHVHVTHPVKAPVARTVVSVYESATLTCDDIAFARIGADELAAVLVAEETVTSGGDVTGALSGISRTDRKLVVARGYDAGDTWITAGCAQQDLVDGNVVLKISTMATVNAAQLNELGAVDKAQVKLSLLNLAGAAAENRRALWTVYGPAGSSPMKPSGVALVGDAEWEPAAASCSNNEGIVLMHPVPPQTVGGYAVQLRAEWAVQLPSLYSGFAASFAPTPLTAPNESRKLCGIRKQGAVTRLVCLDGTVARDLELVVSSGKSALITRDTRPIGPEAQAVVSVPRGTERDVYVVTRNGNYAPLFSGPAPQNTSPCAACGAPVVDALVAPACGPAPAKILLRIDVPGDQQIKVMASDGSGLATFPTTAGAAEIVVLDNAGCVTRLDPDGGIPTLRQVITYHVATKTSAGELVPTTTRAAYTCVAGVCAGNDLLVPGAGVGFTSAGESRMVIAGADATGVVLTHLVMAQFQSNRDRFIERARFPAATAPDRIVAGQFDADGDPDLLWVSTTRRGTTFEVAYARQVGTQPLEALSLPQSASIGSLDAGDLDGDGLDEIVLTGDFGASAVTGAIVIPMHASAEAVALPDDATCGP